MRGFQQEWEVGWVVIMTSVSCVTKPVLTSKQKKKKKKMKVRVSFISTLKNDISVQIIILNYLQKNWCDRFGSNTFHHLDSDLDIDDVH